MNVGGKATTRRDKGRRTRPKGYAPWNPKSETLAVIRDVQKVLEEYSDLLPLPNRQIFYVLEGMGYPKTEKFYKNQLCEYLVRARRARMIPWDAIVDEGAVWLEPENVYEDLEDFERHVMYWGKRYRKDLLYNQDVLVRVHCEAASLAPQLRRTADPYTVPVTSGGGSDSVHVRRELSEIAIRNLDWKGKPTVFLHLGDYDPTGESIFEVFREDISAFVSRDYAPEEVVSFQRVMLSREQAVRHRLSTKPPKESDRRAKNWSGTHTTQLEAAGPELHRRYLTEAIEGALDMDLFGEARAVEAEEKRVLRENPPEWSRQGGAA